MAEGKPIRKTAKKDTADKPAARRGRPPGSKNKVVVEGEVETTALARVEPVVTVAEPKPEFTPAQIRAAQKLDDRIVKTIERVGKDVLELGTLGQEMQDKGYHRALGFGNFTDYLQARSKESKTQVLQAMRVVRELASGDNPLVAREDLREMPKDNAEGLAKLKRQGVKITATLIDEAKTYSVRKFRDEIVDPKLGRALARDQRDSGRPESGALDTGITEVYQKIAMTLSGTVASRWRKVVEIADWLTKDNASKQTYDDRVIEAIAGEFLATYESDYEEMRKTSEGDTAAFAAADIEGTVVAVEDESQELAVAEDFLDAPEAATHEGL